MFNFEKLDVWQKAVVLADVIYSQTRNFPADERFGLINQMRRSVVSLSSNIFPAIPMRGSEPNDHFSRKRRYDPHSGTKRLLQWP